MTGYGRATVEQGGQRVVVEVRSVNHRFFDLKIRGRGLSAEIEDAAATLLRGRIARGALNLSITASITTPGAGTSGASIDHEAAAIAHRQLTTLAHRLGVPGPDLALVLAQPGVVTARDVEAELPQALVRQAVTAATAELVAMRSREGEALATELTSRTASLGELRGRIATLATGLPAVLAQRLGDRLRSLVADGLEPGRLAQELALLADRADITEELVRWDSHLGQLRELLVVETPMGRKLDFLIQELGRELNTVGSKSASAEITQLVVEAKAELERLREQAQNVE